MSERHEERETISECAQRLLRDTTDLTSDEKTYLRECVDGKHNMLFFRNKFDEVLDKAVEACRLSDQ